MNHSEEWLLNEVNKALAHVSRMPREKPKRGQSKRQYAAGLYDMAKWIRDILEKERDWQELRALLGANANRLPKHGYELMLPKESNGKPRPTRS